MGGNGSRECSFENAWAEGCCDDRSREAPDNAATRGSSSAVDPKVNAVVRREIRKLFQRFDQNASGEIKKEEVEAMVAELRFMGYTFVGDDVEVMSSLLLHRNGEGKNGGVLVEAEMFSEWFRCDVVSRAENLRTLLFSSYWVQSLITRLHKAADANKSGFVSEDELRSSIRDVYTELKEPAPDEGELREVIGRMIANDINGDGQLSLSEFRPALVELIAEVYYKHFDPSADPFLCPPTLRTPRRMEQSFHPPASVGSTKGSTAGSTAGTITPRILRRKQEVAFQPMPTVVEPVSSPMVEKPIDILQPPASGLVTHPRDPTTRQKQGSSPELRSSKKPSVARSQEDLRPYSKQDISPEIPRKFRLPNRSAA